MSQTATARPLFGMTEPEIAAAVYLRISQDDEQNGLAIERQREDCLAILAARGWRLHETYIDQGISASKRHVRRPAYERMVADYERGHFGAIVAWDLDRLTRQPRQLEDWIDAAESRGLRIVTANGEADLSTDGGIMFARIKASVASAEIMRKGARQRRANAQSAERGLPVSGRRLYGYKRDGITPEPLEADIVRRIFAEIVDGKSIYGIAQALTLEGVPFGTGNHAARARKGLPPSPWRPQRILQLTRNRRYIGEIFYRGNWTPSPHVQPIITPAEFDSVRAILEDPARRTNPGPARRHLLSGIATCGYIDADGTPCLAPLKVTGTGKARAVGGAYLCSASYSHSHMIAPRVETHALARTAEIIAETGAAGLPDLEGEISSLTAALDRLEAEQSAILADRADDLISPAVARARLLDLKSQRLPLEAAIAKARVAQAPAGALLAEAAALFDHSAPPIAESLRVAAIIRERLEALDFDRRREVIRSLVYVTLLPAKARDGRRRSDAERVQVASRAEVDRGELSD